MDPQGTFAVLKTVFVSDYSRFICFLKREKHLVYYLDDHYSYSGYEINHPQCIIMSVYFLTLVKVQLYFGWHFHEKKVSFWLSFTFQISDAKSSWVAAHQKSITISSCLSAITSKASNRKISLEKIAQPFTPGKSRESRDRLALKLILMMREAPACFTKEKQKIKVPLSGR